MSAVGNTQSWPAIPAEVLKLKYEKCRNITEEIYKRINLTFEIKKLETNSQSDLSEHSDQIDSNELSNETDLFACDKSDSISSSTEAGKPAATCEKYININNNEETKLKKMAGTVNKRPRKRFRKRVKKRQSKAKSESEGSSDEAVPLSRIVDIDTKCKSEDDNSKSESPDNVMGVPNIVIITKNLKQTKSTEPSKPKVEITKVQNEIKEVCNGSQITNKYNVAEVKNSCEIEKAQREVEKAQQFIKKSQSLQVTCTLCSLSFRGERGLRRHMTMSHILSPEDSKISIRHELRGTRPA